MIPRHGPAALRRLARGFPTVALTGPRQSGKTTRAVGGSGRYEREGVAVSGWRAFAGMAA